MENGEWRMENGNRKWRHVIICTTYCSKPDESMSVIVGKDGHRSNTPAS